MVKGIIKIKHTNGAKVENRSTPILGLRPPLRSTQTMDSSTIQDQSLPTFNGNGMAEHQLHRILSPNPPEIPSNPSESCKRPRSDVTTLGSKPCQTCSMLKPLCRHWLVPKIAWKIYQKSTNKKRPFTVVGRDWIHIMPISRVCFKE